MVQDLTVSAALIYKSSPEAGRLLNRGKIHNGIRSSQHFSLKRFKRRFCTDLRGRIQHEFCDDDDKGSGGGVGAGGGGSGGAADVTTLLLSTVLTENMHTTSKVSFETRSTGNVSRKVVSEPSCVPTVSVPQSTFQPNKVLFSQQKSSTTAYASFTNTPTARTFFKNNYIFLGGRWYFFSSNFKPYFIFSNANN